jgi:hypothetical protein
MSNVDLVKEYLRAQNLEQLQRIDEAIELYEHVVAAGFDAAGPFDRLIALYSHQGLHGEVVRVASQALELVHTHEGKLDWYRDMRAEAEKAAARVPKASPKRADRPG